MAILCALGFASGLPYQLTGTTLSAWLTSRNVPLARIGLMWLVGLAYNLKFAWAPLLDRFRLPWLGRRRGWMLALQLALVGAIAAMGAVDPVAHPARIAAWAVAVALLSASQDVVLDAYSADVLASDQRAAGSAVYVMGYRIALVVTGTLALVLGDHLPWRVVYAALAALMVIGIVATLVAEEPPRAPHAPTTLRDALVLPFAEFARRHRGRGTALLLVFAGLYEVAYFVEQGVMIPFLVRGAGFTLSEIAAVYKALVFAGTAFGSAIAGAAVQRFGLRRMVVVAGAGAAVTHLAYAALAVVGRDFPLFCTAVLVDSIANACVITAFLAVLMGVISPAVSATQLAVLTSLSSVGQRALGPITGAVVAAVGWPGLFVGLAVLAVPGTAISWWVGQKFADASGPA
jgi:PAT family beta-lactamase induction signal transducer AmpG